MNDKKPMSKRRKKELIFITILLAYPVIQFLATWIFVNSYSVILAFENVPRFLEKFDTFR